MARFPRDGEIVRSVVAAAAPTATVGTPPGHNDACAGWIDHAWDFRLPHRRAPKGAKWIWAWPLVAAAILAVAGFWANNTITRVMRTQVASELLALRDADVAALSENFAAHQQFATIAASDPDVVAFTLALFALRDFNRATLTKSPELVKLREVLGPWLGQYEYDGFRILTREGRCIASWRDITLGGSAAKEELECLSTVFAGKATISRRARRKCRLPTLTLKNAWACRRCLCWPRSATIRAGSSPRSAFGCVPSATSRGCSTSRDLDARGRPSRSIGPGSCSRKAVLTTT